MTDSFTPGFFARYHVSAKALAAAQELVKANFDSADSSAIVTAKDLAMVTTQIEATGQCPELVSDLNSILKSKLTTAQKFLFWVAAVFTFGISYIYGARVVEKALQATAGSSDAPTGLKLLSGLAEKIEKAAPVLAACSILTVSFVTVDTNVANKLSGGQNVGNFRDLMAITDRKIAKGDITAANAVATVFKTTPYCGNKPSEVVAALNRYAECVFGSSGNALFKLADKMEDSNESLKEPAANFAELFDLEIARQKALIEEKEAEFSYIMKCAEEFLSSAPDVKKLFDPSEKTSCIARTSVAAAKLDGGLGSAVKTAASAAAFKALFGKTATEDLTDDEISALTEGIVAAALRDASKEMDAMTGRRDFLSLYATAFGPSKLATKASITDAIQYLKAIYALAGISCFEGSSPEIILRDGVSASTEISDDQLTALNDFYRAINTLIDTTAKEINTNYKAAKVDGSKLTKVGEEEGKADMLATDAAALFMKSHSGKSTAESTALTEARAATADAVAARNDLALKRKPTTAAAPATKDAAAKTTTTK
ncbi:MAG: hypothetical protein LBH53_00080 [Puniceicoccales bacterium]|jgi:hypothetical protein|nr:hypothetical protein [Puniceicoccales bacterium]